MRATIIVRVAAAFGSLLGALSMLAGGRVLAGIDRPDYVVLPWLVVYNVAAGFAGVIAGAGIWLSRRWAIGLARGLAGAHAAVLMVLAMRVAAGRAVATESLLAMSFRTLVWISIAFLARRTEPPSRGSSPAPAKPGY